MAKENVKKFFDEVSKSEDLQKRLKAATEKPLAEVQKALEAQSAAVVEVAKKAGFDFTAQEMLEQSAGNQKLDQGELDAVAGGGVCFFVGGGGACNVIGTGRGYGCFIGGVD